MMVVGCSKKVDVQQPTVITNNVTSVTSKTAVSGGIITSDGGAAILASGVCWNNGPMPLVSNSKTTEGTKSFVSTLSGLDGNTKYYVRAYATNISGTAYGEEITFNTLAGEVKIGGQIWMDKNLNVSQYLNGDPVSYVLEGTQWIGLSSGGRTDYENSSSNGDVYGHLYNWYAITDSRKLCPAGWHVSTESDWNKLVDFLGGISVAGGKMKETGTSHWNGPNSDGTNESGFTALPGGHRYTDGGFYNLKIGAYFWTSTAVSSTSAEYRNVSTNGPGVSVNTIPKVAGLSVRCVKD